MRARVRKADEFVVQGVAERVASYEFGRPCDTSAAEVTDAELVERAAALLLVMPPNQSRKTIEELVSPHDPERGQKAVAELIDAAIAAEDTAGRLRSSQ